MALTNYAEKKILDHLVGKAAFTMPTAYVALYTSVPNEDGTGGVEVSGGGYSRMQTSPSDWEDAAEGGIQNAVNLEWDASTADWGTIVGIALVDASTSGNVLVRGEAVAQKTIESGDMFRISAGNLVLSLD